MSKKGYSNVIVLYLFIIISSLCLIILNINIYKIKTIYNLKKANNFLNQELVIINYLKCKLLNNGLIDESIVLNGINFTINSGENIIEVTVNSDIYEIIRVYIDNNRITDYETSISEEIGI